jgi:hypothetical protein
MIELFQAFEFADPDCPLHIPKRFHLPLRIGEGYGVWRQWRQARSVAFHIAVTRVLQPSAPGKRFKTGSFLQCGNLQPQVLRAASKIDPLAGSQS